MRSHLIPFRPSKPVDGVTTWPDGSTSEASGWIEHCQGPDCPSRCQHNPDGWMSIEVKSPERIEYGTGEIGWVHGTRFQFCSPACMSAWAGNITEVMQ